MRLFYNCPVYNSGYGNEGGLAVLCKDGIIASIGKTEDYDGIDCPSTDLRGSFLAPAFIESHCHFLGCADKRLSVDLSGSTDLEEVKKRILRAAAAPVKIVRAVNFENNMCESLDEAAVEIDRDFSDVPVMVANTSGHGGFINKYARKKYGVESNKTYLVEKEFTDAQSKLPMPLFEDLLCAARKTEKDFLSRAITTVQEGYIERSTMNICLKLYDALDTSLDIIGYISPFDFDDPEENEKIFSGYLCRGRKRESGFRIGGYKIIIDGSPQMRTAYMSRDYAGGGRGILSLSPEKIDFAVRRAVSEGRQLLAHCNGDAAADEFISSAERAAAKGADISALRFVIIHGFMLTAELMERASRLGMMVSFFPEHIERFSDVHIANLGIERAGSMAPAATAIKKGLRCTFHTDAPVTPPDLMRAVFCACARLGKNNSVIGADERISVEEAFAGICENAAFQYFQEGLKGTVSPGALSRFAVLDRNPFTCSQSEIPDIKVSYADA